MDKFVKCSAHYYFLCAKKALNSKIIQRVLWSINESGYIPYLFRLATCSSKVLEKIVFSPAVKK
mgnify:FL=1